MEAVYNQGQTTSIVLTRKGFWILLLSEVLVVGFYTGMGGLLLGAILGTILLLGILYKPFWGLILSVFAIPLRVPLPHLGNIVIARVIGILTILGIFLHVAINGQAFKIKISREIKVLIFFLSTASLSVIFGKNFGPSLLAFLELCFCILFLWMVTYLIDNKRKLKVFLWSLALSGTASGALGLHQVFTEQLYRAEGLMGDPNFFALTLLPLSIITLSMIFTQESIALKILFSSLFAISFLGSIAALSRGGVIALAIALLYFIFRQNKRFRYLFLLVIAGFILNYIAGDVFHLVITSKDFFNPSRTASSYHRYLILLAGLKMFLSHPILGVGIGSFTNQVGLYSTASSLVSHYFSHNTPLEIACEMGIFGFFSFIIFIFLVFNSLEMSYRLDMRHHKRDEAVIVIGIQSALLGYLVGSFFLSALTLKHLWVLIALSFVMHRFSHMNLSVNGIIKHTKTCKP